MRVSKEVVARQSLELMQAWTHLEFLELTQAWTHLEFLELIQAWANLAFRFALTSAHR